MNFGESFLSNPDLFPARQTGETWGDEQVVIQFAGNDYICAGMSATQAAAVRERFGPMCAAAPQSPRPSVVLTAFRAADADFVSDERVWEFDFDLDYAPDAVSFAGFHFMGRLDWLPRLQAALWSPEDERLVSHAIFENVLRVVAAYHLLEQGGLLLHSAAVADATGADIFFGPSGAGKSTISRLGHDAGRRVLSDDMNALRATPTGVVVEKLPFAGDFGQTTESAGVDFQVRGLYHLQQGPRHEVAPMSRARAVAALLGCAPFVNRNPFRYDELVRKLQDLNARLPVRVLTFSPEPSLWGLLDGQRK